MLSQIELDYWDSGTATGDAISAISYDARGRRTSVQYGNGTVSEYTYDPLSHRLERLESTKTGGTPNILQDNTYTYDAVRNITTIVDASQEACYFSNQGIDGTRTYTYDPLYRLIQADGREHDSLVASPGYQTPGWGSYSAQSIPDTTSPAFRGYEEEYTYDAVGNLTSIAHSAVSNNWTRTFSIDGGSNRTASTTVSPVTETFLYDSHGNLSEMNHLQTDGADLGIRYNHWDRMDRTRHGTGTGAYFIYYQYDSQGRRVRKIRETSAAAVRSTQSYFGDWELYENFVSSSSEETLHVSDGERRFLIIEQNPAGQPGGSFTRTWRYQLTDHLGSATVELDESENVLTREEYYPYGTSSFYGEGSGSFSTKRYRFTGQEKDEESGLQYHHHRYYAPWLGRWTRPDPAGMVDGPARYGYLGGSPVGAVDPTGLGADQMDMAAFRRQIREDSPTSVATQTPDEASSATVDEAVAQGRLQREGRKWVYFGVIEFKASGEELHKIVESLEHLYLESIVGQNFLFDLRTEFEKAGETLHLQLTDEASSTDTRSNTVFWNPDDVPVSYPDPTQSGERGVPMKEFMPRPELNTDGGVALLFHEMIHAFRHVVFGDEPTGVKAATTRGDRYENTVTGIGTAKDSSGNIAHPSALYDYTENMYRVEQGLTYRDSYWGFPDVVEYYYRSPFENPQHPDRSLVQARIQQHRRRWELRNR